MRILTILNADLLRRFNAKREGVVTHLEIDDPQGRGNFYDLSRSAGNQPVLLHKAQQARVSFAHFCDTTQGDLAARSRRV